VELFASSLNHSSKPKIFALSHATIIFLNLHPNTTSKRPPTSDLKEKAKEREGEREAKREKREESHNANANQNKYS